LSINGFAANAEIIQIPFSTLYAPADSICSARRRCTGIGLLLFIEQFQGVCIYWQRLFEEQPASDVQAGPLRRRKRKCFKCSGKCGRKRGRTGFFQKIHPTGQKLSCCLLHAENQPVLSLHPKKYILLQAICLCSVIPVSVSQTEGIPALIPITATGASVCFLANTKSKII